MRTADRPPEAAGGVGRLRKGGALLNRKAQEQSVRERQVGSESCSCDHSKTSLMLSAADEVLTLCSDMKILLMIYAQNGSTQFLSTSRDTTKASDC